MLMTLNSDHNGTQTEVDKKKDDDDGVEVPPPYVHDHPQGGHDDQYSNPVEKGSKKNVTDNKKPEGNPIVILNLLCVSRIMTFIIKNIVPKYSMHIKSVDLILQT